VTYFPTLPIRRSITYWFVYLKGFPLQNLMGSQVALMVPNYERKEKSPHFFISVAHSTFVTNKSTVSVT
jgi:hypothetical protein